MTTGARGLLSRSEVSCWEISGVLPLLPSRGEATLLGDKGAAVEGALVIPEMRELEAAFVEVLESGTDRAEELAE